jgi:hypothetical protein
MALIAINAVINIPADILVMEIGRVPVPMASGALKDTIVTGVRMASRTDAIGVPVIHIEPRVIEGRSRPRRGGVARLTARGESGRLMVGIGRLLVLRRVTAIAVGWEARIVIVYMAIRADHGVVSTGERKGRVVMIKNTLGPNHRVVAQRAVGRETGVIDRCQRIAEICLVASNAGRAGHAVVVIDVAGSAGHAYVRAGQRKAGRGMIE